MNDLQTSSPMKRKLRHLWVHGFIWGIVIVLIGLLIWFFGGGTSLISVSQHGQKGPPVKATPGPSLPAGTKVALLPPPQSPATLKDQLGQVLSGIIAANQEKDLAKLLSYYSPNFPGLTNRAQSISKSWKTYNYAKMAFDIKEVKPLADNKAVARVTWNIEAQYINTRKSKSFSKTYLIKFVKESGRWRIEALNNVP
jgi:hypothetical protein